MLPNYHVKEKETQKTEETFVELKKCETTFISPELLPSTEVKRPSKYRHDGRRKGFPAYRLGRPFQVIS